MFEEFKGGSDRSLNAIEINPEPDVVDSFELMLFVIGGFSASAGILSPILTYWISNKSGSAQGWELGKQTAAASLGVTAGSLLGGLALNIAVLPSFSFVLIGGLTTFGFLFSFGLPRVLVSRNAFNAMRNRG